jgi:hypothetical protein
MSFSAATLFASFLVSTVGLGFFLYGKKMLRIPQLVSGIAMMVYPCFLGSATVIYAIGGALVTALWIAVRLGW